MPYALLHDETVDTAIRRIMDEQIVRAREQLCDAQLPPERRVHEARKRFKETRAVIRLVREPLGARFAVENGWFRDAGRDLASIRDADAVLEALGKLEAPKPLLAQARRHLRRQRTHPPLEGLIANAVDQLVVAQARVALWPRFENSFAALEAGLRRIYREGRAASRRAGTAEELHEWRKSVKTHWYHAELLRNLWPEIMETYASVLHSLSRTLGDHHDLYVLGEALGEAGAPLEAAIAARQQTLKKNTRELGLRVYAESPGRWTARMKDYWDAWR